jgi:hypothetical protein
MPQHESGHEEDFSRIRVLHFLAGGVASDVDIAATGVERAENVAGLSGDGLRGRQLGLCRRGARRARRRLRFLGDRGRRRPRGRTRFHGGSWRILGRRGVSLGRRRWGHGPSRRCHGIGSDGGCRCGCGLVFPVDVAAHVIGRGVENFERGNRDVVRGATPAEHKNSEKEKSSRFHVVYLSAILFAARDFVTSATNSSICCSVVAHEHISR